MKLSNREINEFEKTWLRKFKDYGQEPLNYLALLEAAVDYPSCIEEMKLWRVKHPSGAFDEYYAEKFPPVPKTETVLDFSKIEGHQEHPELIAVKTVKEIKYSEVQEIKVAVYDIVGRTPNDEGIRSALRSFSKDEIINGFREYVEFLSPKELQFAIFSFFKEKGFEGVLFSRRQKADTRAKYEQQAKRAIEEGREKFLEQEKKLLIDRSENEEAQKRIESDPSLLFGTPEN